MWTTGLILLLIGYAFFYTGLGNFRSGGQGPTLSESFGLSPIAPPGGAGAGDKPGPTDLQGYRVPGT